jgi:hypothetical protein
VKILYTSFVLTALCTSLFANTDLKNLYIQDGRPAVILSAETNSGIVKNKLYLATDKPTNCSALNKTLNKDHYQVNKKSVVYLVKKNQVTQCNPCKVRRS